MEISELLVTEAENCDKEDLRLGICLLKERIKDSFSKVSKFLSEEQLDYAHDWILLLKADTWMIENLLAKFNDLPDESTPKDGAGIKPRYINKDGNPLATRFEKVPEIVSREDIQALALQKLSA